MCWKSVLVLTMGRPVLVSVIIGELGQINGEPSHRPAEVVVGSGGEVLVPIGGLEGYYSDPLPEFWGCGGTTHGLETKQEMVS